MSKDCKRYFYKNNIYCKRQLVKKIVEDYISANKNITFPDLEKVFPPEIQQKTKLKIASFDVFRKTEDITDSQDKHYFSEEILLNDGIKIRINSGWDKENVVAFIEVAKKLGYSIKEIKQEENL